MVYGLYRALPGEPGFLATVAPEKLASQELDTSIGVSGPHDFAVRLSAVRQWHRPRPPHPASNVRDDRETPLVRNGMARVLEVIWVRRKPIYFCKPDWTTQITLIRLNKLVFSRNAPGADSLTPMAHPS